MFTTDTDTAHSLVLPQAERTETEQIYKMLELLPKRGPHAFERFVGVLERDYPWLATLLVSGAKSTPVRENTTRESTRHDLVSVDNNSRGEQFTAICTGGGGTLCAN